MTLALLAAALLAAAPAAPSTARRVAVLVGANQGALGRASLRYSHRDAQQLAEVLSQVGQFAPADVHVLNDPAPAEVLAVLDRELAALREAPESLFVFYYSGHADAGALYPSGSPLSYADLRERLDGPSATVRVGIIDACSGGGWTGAKGVHPGAPFAVDVPLTLTSEGSVLIASSSGVENAHESEVLGGSFFTHHLVAALRGAGDARGDGVVTLADAFAYAKERTVRDTAAASEPQHPSFSMNLRGRADLPLTRVASASTLVDLREERGPLQLVHLSSGLVVLEVPPGKRALKLSVPPGRYLVRRQGTSGSYVREIAVEPGQVASVNEADLELTSVGGSATKGWGAPADWPLAVNDRPLTLRAHMVELQLGTLLGTNPIERIGKPFGVAPGLRYGVTDDLSLSVGVPDGFCVGTSCPWYLDGVVQAIADLSVTAGGPFELVGTTGFSYSNSSFSNPTGTLTASGQAIDVRLGFTARFVAGPVAFALTPELHAMFGFGALGGVGGWYRVTPSITVQALPRLAFDLTMVATDPKASNPFQDGIVSLAAGATYAISSHLDARAFFRLEDVVERGGLPAPGYARTLGLAIALRP
jgi:hypothetical protein